MLYLINFKDKALYANNKLKILWINNYNKIIRGKKDKIKKCKNIRENFLK